jgi:arsenate reductase
MSLPAKSDDVLLLHNPACSKSRATHALLRERGIAFRERSYLDDPLSVDELRELVRRLGASDLRWVRTGEPAWRASGLDACAPLERVLATVAACPELLERPVVVRAERAALGRPPESVLSLFPRGTP